MADRPSLHHPLPIRDLPEAGLEIQESLDVPTLESWVGEALSRGPIEAKLIEGAEARITVRPLDTEDPPTVRVKGWLRARLATGCVRCLESVDLPLEAEIDATLAPPNAGCPAPVPVRGKGKAVPVKDGEALEPWAETFPEPEALAEDHYDGLSLPLPALLGEALLVEIPSDPVCADQAACDERTARLIEGANAEVRASDAEGDPRWAALRALRDDPERKR